MYFLFGLSISAFLVLLLLFKKQKSKADHILTVWLSVLTLHLLLFYLNSTEWIYQHPHLLGLSLPLPILQGVFLYLYTRELTFKDAFRSSFWWAHLVPFFVLIGLAFPFYSLSGPEKVAVFEQEGAGFEWYFWVRIISFLVSGFTYSILTVVWVRKYRKRLLEYLSNIDKQMLRWLEFLAVGLAAIWICVGLFEDQIIFMGVVTFILLIGFFGIRHVPVFYGLVPTSTEPSLKTPESVPAPPSTKYQKSGLTQTEIDALFNRLQSTMETDRLYQNGDLKLQDLATHLSVHPNHLSQAINSHTGHSFYHYINSLRIDAFLELAAQPKSKQFTYLALAFECGFNSKSTFNKYFKLHTGKTPSQYFKSAE